MSDLNPTTVLDAGPIMAGAVGLSWPEDRSEVLGEINRFRNHLYNLHPRFQLFDNAYHCICVSKYPQRCPNPCVTSTASCFSGFTLPPDVAGVEEAREYGYPLKVRSRWREAHFGEHAMNTPRVEVVETGEQWCTERAMTKIAPLWVFAEDAEDHGRVLTIEAEDDAGKRITLQFTLIGDGWAKVERPVRAIHRVSLPQGRKGSITLAQADGYELSIYAPWESVPNYRLFRVASYAGNNGRILIRGAKRFVDVWFDSDVVEVGDRLVIEEYGAFRQYRSNTKEKGSLERAEYSRSEMESQLKGVLSRSRGNAIQDGSPFRGRRTSPSGILPGLGR